MSEITPDMLFEKAAKIYLEHRTIQGLAQNRRRYTGYLALNTENSYTQYVDSLLLFFESMPLRDIRPGNLRAYQRGRLRGDDPFIRPRRPKAPPTPSPVKPKKVNQELGLLHLIMKQANAWTDELELSYEPLAEEVADIPRALTPEEQNDWLACARSRPAWELVYHYSVFAFDTCMSTDELRALRIGDINLQHGTVVVQRGKVRSRSRTIQLTGADVLWAAEKLLQRAALCGAVSYTDSLFPFRRGLVFYPDVPMTVSGIKKPWNEVRDASGLLWFTPYGTRHTGITRLAEAGIPIAVIKQRAGHITDKMSAHYTQISESAARQWMMHADAFRSSFHPGITKFPPQRDTQQRPYLSRRGTQIPQRA